MKERTPEEIGMDVAEAGALIGDEGEAVAEAAARFIRIERRRLRLFAAYVADYSNDPVIVRKARAVLGEPDRARERELIEKA